MVFLFFQHFINYRTVWILIVGFYVWFKIISVSSSNTFLKNLSIIIISSLGFPRFSRGFPQLITFIFLDPWQN